MRLRYFVESAKEKTLNVVGSLFPSPWLKDHPASMAGRKGEREEALDSAREIRIAKAYIGAVAKSPDDFVETIDPHDKTYLFARQLPNQKVLASYDYFRMGRESVLSIDNVLRTSGRMFGDVSSFLDFASGYGMVTRFLIQEIDPGRVWVSDVDRDAVDFQKKSFGINGLYSGTEPSRVKFPRRFEVIYAESLFCHLPANRFKEWLTALYDILEDKGILIFSTVGQWARPPHAKADSSGFTFLKKGGGRPSDAHGYYGDFFVTKDWVCGLAREIGITDLHYLQKELWGCQDVYVAAKGYIPSLKNLLPTDYGRGSVDFVQITDNGKLCVKGWAAAKESGSPVDGISIYAEGKLLGRAILGTLRPDVEKHFVRPDYLRSGWEFRGSLGEADSGRLKDGAPIVIKALIETRGDHVACLVSDVTTENLVSLAVPGVTSSSLQEGTQEIFENDPLVSIIVRTKDRPTLLISALRSIAAQTYRPIEVILVNDGGCDLDTENLKNILGDVFLNYIRLERNTGRAHAGNVGIEAAAGKYVGFLDDDDELCPEHVAILVSSLREGGYEVAYSAVDLIEKTYDAAGVSATERKKEVFAHSFSYSELLLGNYIPLMAVLFKSELIKGVRFDENFELYEDWDVLIRIAGKTSFHFINSVTAKYHLWGDTQINYRKSLERLRGATVSIYSKHWSKIPPLYLFELRESFAKAQERVQTLETALHEETPYIRDLEAAVQERNRRTHELERMLLEKNGYIHRIHSGRGWRLLTRYYRIRDSLLPSGTTRRAAAKLIISTPKLFTRESMRKVVHDARIFGLRVTLGKIGTKLSEMKDAGRGASFPYDGADMGFQAARTQDNALQNMNFNRPFLKSDRLLRNRRLVELDNPGPDREKLAVMIEKIKGDLLKSFKAGAP